MKKTIHHTRVADNLAFIMLAALVLIAAMAFNSCAGGTKSTGSCKLTKGLVGY